MDAWLLICIITVGLAIFEYAICLATLFGKLRMKKITAKEKGADAAQWCIKIDRFALWSFVVAYNISVATYYCILISIMSYNITYTTQLIIAYYYSFVNVSNLNN